VKIPENTHNLLKTNFTIENSIETRRVGCVVCVCVCVSLSPFTSSDFGVY
jgi:hypothetical protein